MLEVTGLNGFYGQGHILHDINLSVSAGERVAVLGRNGAGKSTFLKALMNAGPTSRGRVKFDGVDMEGLATHSRARMGLAFVPEDRRIFAHLTVVENIAMGRFGANGRNTESPESILKRFSMLEPLRTRYGGQLSGGQQQLLAVARAFAASPRLLLLDEPTEGLAPIIIERMAKEIKASCETDKVGLILCEQNIWFARQCTSRLCIIDTGRTVFSGSWEQFDKDPRLKSKYLAI